jgi:hypothetical protein
MVCFRRSNVNCACATHGDAIIVAANRAGTKQRTHTRLLRLNGTVYCVDRLLRRIRTPFIQSVALSNSADGSRLLIWYTRGLPLN